MTRAVFDRYKNKLSQNVYGSLKGRLRLTLLERDVREYVADFSCQRLSILDVGCGEGLFANICLLAGHAVLLLDASEKMLESARHHVESGVASSGAEQVRFTHADFLEWQHTDKKPFDVVLMHGSAEWMPSAEDAIEKAIQLIRPGGYLSLLMFNRDVHLLKKGINGHLFGPIPNRKQKLFPPNSQSVAETIELLKQHSGEILLQSGIRIFHGFFRAMDVSTVSPDIWLAQEEAYYRQQPFSRLGQHTHFIWQKVFSVK